MSKTLIFSIGLLLCMGFSAAASEIVGLRLGTHPDKTRIVVEMTGNADFRAEVSNNPKQLNIYLPADNWRVRGDTVLVPPFTAVRHDRLTGGVGMTHLTLPMTKPMIIRTAYLLPGQNGTPHRLVVDMTDATEVEFAAATQAVHGSLAVHNRSLNDVLQTIVTTSGPVPVAKPSFKKPVIVIDAGHGGVDPGAISPGGIKEKDITLAMAKTIARTLNATGRYDARLTRTTDKFIKLHDRVKIARAAKADIFMSIHADSVGNRTTRGASIYTLSDKASDEQTARLAARENRADLIGGIDLNEEDEDVTAILLDLSMRETMNQSKFLANTVVVSFGFDGVNVLENPHRYAGFAVLKAPDVPSVLIETGFVSNEGEARRLLSVEYQQKVAVSLMRSLDRYFETLRSDR